MYDRYVVKNGETINSIAQKLNVDPLALQKINQIYYSGELRAGTEIIVPENQEQYFNTYVIEKGDSLYAIARKYNINPELLAAMNGLNDEDYIYPGQELLIPKSGYSYYLTAEGDTLDTVSSMFKTTKENILKENQTIYLLPGQLLIKKK